MSSAQGASNASSDRLQAAVTYQGTRRPISTTAESTDQTTTTATSEDADESSLRPPKRGSRMQRMSSSMESSRSGPVNYTRTGRISKAKKGVRGAHVCTCGKTYSRAEHLRRHAQNHGETLYCSYSDCDKIFHREDLLRRHERNHETGQTMDHSASRSPSIAYTAAPATNAVMSTSYSTTNTPAFSPAPTPATMISQPPTPYHDPSTSMSAPRYTVSQFNQFRRISQPNLLGPFLASDAKSKSVAPTGLGLQSMPSLAIPSDGNLVSAAMPLLENALSASTSYSSYDPPWTSAYSTYMPTQSPIITSNESWSQAAAIHSSLMSPVSGMAPQGPYWYPTEKAFGSVDTNLALSYPMELQTMLPTATEAVSPYVPYVTTAADWDQSSVQSMTPITVKAELSSPVSLDNQSLSTTLSLHAKQSYIDAYWEYMHPLYPILHKPTMEQQRHLDRQQSGSDLLLKAAIVICGTVHTKDDSRWTDGRVLLRKVLQQLEHEQHSLDYDLATMQALFLIEAYAQYHSQRASPQLSSYFNSVVNQLQDDAEVRGASARPTRMASPFDGEKLAKQWLNWILIHSRQRLLTACSVLMGQTALYLTHERNMPRADWGKLDLPCSTILWHASSPSDWRALLITELHASSIDTAVAELSNYPANSLDPFQSLVLSTAYSITPFAAPSTVNALQNSLSAGLEVRLHLYAGLMAHITPLRALLAIAGESWTPSGGRLATCARTSADLLGRMKVALRGWVVRGMSNTGPTFTPGGRHDSVAQENSDASNETRGAVQYALTILRIAVQIEEQDRCPPFASEMPIYIATLVLWAVGHDAMLRSTNPIYSTITPPASGSSDFTSASARQGLLAFIEAADNGLFTRLCSGADMNTALQWRQGVDAAMRWTRLRVGGFTPLVSSSNRSLAPESSVAAAERPRSQSMPQIRSQPQHQPHFPLQAQLGELNAGVINVLRRLEARGWAGAWF